MPDEDDFAGMELLLEPAVLLFLCVFLWVDFIEPFSLPVLSIESLVECVGVADVDDDMGADFEAAESCAKAAPVIRVQPASMARISFVLRMTKFSWNVYERLGFSTECMAHCIIRVKTVMRFGRC